MKIEIPQYPRSSAEQILVILALGILSLVFAVLVLGCQQRKIPPEFIDLIKTLITVVTVPVAFDKLTSR